MDAIDCDKISGWAFANSGGYAYLDIYAPDLYTLGTGNMVKVATIKANTASRPDVRAAFGNNPNIPLDCGFVWAIPDTYKNGRQLTIKVVPVNDISPIGNSPMTTSGNCEKPVTPGGTTGPWKPSTVLTPDMCMGTNRYGYPSNFTDGDDDFFGNGNAAHYIIQTYYKGVHPNEQVELEYAIPKSSALGNTGYADIVNKSTAEIFEIKSVAGKDAGNEEVERYVLNASLYCNSAMNWHRGKNFPQKIELPWITASSKLTVFLDSRVPNGGVITYKLETILPKSMPVTVTQNDWQKIKDLLQQMALNLDNATNLANNFVRDNPTLVGILVGVGIVEITTGIISEIISAGTATVPAVALAASGAILITVATK